MAKHEKWQKLDIASCYFDVTKCWTVARTWSVKT